VIFDCFTSKRAKNSCVAAASSPERSRGAEAGGFCSSDSARKGLVGPTVLPIFIAFLLLFA